LVWKGKYEELEKEKKKLETELANVKFLSKQDAEQVEVLLKDKNELLERLDQLQKDIDQFQAEHEVIESLKKLLTPVSLPRYAGTSGTGIDKGSLGSYFDIDIASNPRTCFAEDIKYTPLPLFHNL